MVLCCTQELDNHGPTLCHLFPIIVYCEIIYFRGKYDICGPDKSFQAADLYAELRYETFSECVNPCKEMKVSTSYQFKVKDPQDTQSVVILFPTNVEVTHETVTKSLFSAGRFKD